jgi:hypothetical protein
MFADESDTVVSAIRKDAVECHKYTMCFMWASVYQNISTILSDFDIEKYRITKNWTDENNRPLSCELEDGVVRAFDFVILVGKESPFFEIVDEVIHVCGSLSPRHGASSGCGWRNGLLYGG